jgi:membrane protein implicated in regulation of membrane protease activity
MERLSTTQLLLLVIEVSISAFNYWSGPFLSAEAPLWALTAALVAVFVAYRGFLAVRDRWRERREREEARGRQERELLETMKKLLEDGRSGQVPISSAARSK